MKNEKEIRKTLTETKEALKEYQDSPTESEDESIYLGWVEALEYVLACSPVEEVDPDLQWAFDEVARELACDSYWHGTSGLYWFGSHIEEDENPDFDETLPEDSNEVLEGWSGLINFGVQDENSSNTNSFTVFITKKNFEEWKASNENKYQRKTPKWCDKNW